LLLFHAGQFGTVLLKSAKVARLFTVIPFPAGKLLKKGLSVRILIAGNVRYIA
jgi:hypothetical protein